MTGSRLNSPLGVCIFAERGPNNGRTIAYPDYALEILGHAGVCHTTVALDELKDALPGLRLLLTVGEAELDEATLYALRDWVANGGAWLSVAGVCGAEDLFGVEIDEPSYVLWGGGTPMLGEGYLVSGERPHAIFGHEIPLHFFNGLAVRTTTGKQLARVYDRHMRDTRRSAVVESNVGEGKCLLIAPDLTGAVVRIQQGVAVTRDGVPAPDGTAAICDGVLKSDDGAVLDWEFDRQPVPGVDGLNVFSQPISDQWRETLLRCTFHLAREVGVRLPVLWLYPRDLPALGHISHDSDGNDPDLAASMLRALEEAGINSTWCVLSSGYPPETVSAIRNAGHELAMHFDSMSDGTVFAESEFDSQWRKLTEQFGEKPVSNKNHYLRWEGDTEFFEWCVARGIELDQSKGPSKTGGAGYNFGACHPYRPVDRRGAIFDILELPTPTMDLVLFAPPEVTGPMLKTVVRHHGVLHLLFHPAHIEKPGVKEALLGVVDDARNAGVEWWTANGISQWERARRTVTWAEFAKQGDSASVRVSSRAELREASLMWLGAEDVRLNDGVCDTRTVERWGFEFASATVDLEAGQWYELGWREA